MNNRLILQQHAPYATMLNKSLDFCELLLSRSSLLYPFALTTVENEIHCVFVPSNAQSANSEMIEALQILLDEHQKTAKNSANLLVYPATVTHPNSTECDALIFAINDTQGHNTVTIYPYEHVENGIKIKQPYTCDFSD